MNDQLIEEAILKLDLANAYMEMGDFDGARECCNEILHDFPDHLDARSLLEALNGINVEEYLIARSADGEPWVLWLLVQHYQNPTQFQPEKLVATLTQLIEQDDKKAAYELSRFYAEGKGNESDPDLSVRLLLSSAELGYAPAQYDLSESYRYGNRVRMDLAEADLWLHKARLSVLEKMIWEGDEVFDVYDFIRPLTQEGHAEAQYQFALVSDCDEKVSWLTRAAEQEHIDSVYLLSLMFYDDRLSCEIQQNPTEALRWAKRYIDLGGNPFSLPDHLEDGEKWMSWNFFVREARNK